MPKGWGRTRQRILKRDGWKCQWPLDTGGICGEPANEVDHKIGAAQGIDDHSGENLWALCTWHHLKKTGREASAVAHDLPPRERPQGEHPGLIN